MTTLREAAQQALEAMEAGDWYIDQLEMIVYSADDTGTHEERAKVQAAITALRTALAEPDHIADVSKLVEQRTEPVQEPLTAEEVIEHFQTQVDTGSLMSFVEGVRYAERAHGIGGEA